MKGFHTLKKRFQSGFNKLGRCDSFEEMKSPFLAICYWFGYKGFWVVGGPTIRLMDEGSRFTSSPWEWLKLVYYAAISFYLACVSTRKYYAL